MAQEQDFTKLDEKSLQKEVDSFKEELFNLKLNASTMHVKDYSQFRKLRTKIARALTVMRQRQLQQ